MAVGTRVFAVMALGGVLALSATQTPAAFNKGVIDVRPDPDFGQGTDWAKFIENESVSLAVAGDGSVFLAQQRAHAVHKFDVSGRLVRSFGRQGQGPGDFSFPQYLSILDHRYLVVGEQAEGRRVSLFDLDGRFVKLVKTTQNPFSVLALRDGVVAYVTKSFPRKGSLVLQASAAVLLDMNTGKEVKACDQTLFTGEEQVFAEAAGGTPPKGEFGLGQMIINRTGRGDLMVGYTTSPRIFFFAPDGSRLGELRLDYPAMKWTDELWRRFLEAQVEAALELRPGSDPQQVRQSIFKKPRISEYLPYFSEILADAEGRLLVVRRGDCFRHCDPELRVYGPDGGFLGRTILRGGEFEAEIDRRFRNIVFTSDGLLGVFLVKGSPDAERRLIRVRF